MVTCGVRPPKYLPLSEEVITAHLSGELELGLYPLLDGDRCRWLATGRQPISMARR